MKELAVALRFVCSIQFWRMAVLWTLSLIFSYSYLSIGGLVSSLKPKSYPRCSPQLVRDPSTNSNPTRPVCIITGATSGLGKAAAHALSKNGFYIVLVGRSSDSLSKTMEEIKHGNKDAHLKSFLVDISSAQSILKFKASLLRWLSVSNLHPSIQLLINNAGILAASQRISSEGYDQMMATNFIGAFFLTKLILPLLRSSPVPSRIVNVTSFTHRSVLQMQIGKEIVFGNACSGSRYPCAHIYEHSKLCLLLFSYELHRQCRLMDKSPPVSVIAADPGAVDTNIMRELPSSLCRLALLGLQLLGLLQSPEEGVNSIIDAALSPQDTSGVYFFGGRGRTMRSSALSYDRKLAEKLWAVSCDLFREAQLDSEEETSQLISKSNRSKEHLKTNTNNNTTTYRTRPKTFNSGTNRRFDRRPPPASARDEPYFLPKLLFSEVGEMKRYSIHYDQRGNSKGTAEVVFKKQSDALHAIERYHGKCLDGKPMHIELVGANIVNPAIVPSPPIHIGILRSPKAGFKRRQESFAFPPRRRPRGHGGRDFERSQGQGNFWNKKASVEMLDADLDNFKF
ncbi:Short-chain dehydrogenase/reductase SDR [Dillenia turbinata]|uniref:Short-chain dehydrogenase/reductase SDR n=1 Tax=Dillenia turbinata TaxID=194707 RepID=A0AAN8ZCK1_9MAGN